MNNEAILSQFDDLDEKVELLIELCKNLETANAGLKSRIDILEQEVNDKSDAERKYAEQKEKIRIKIDRLLSKMNDFSPASS
ncbi:hypothetical protein JCM14469_31440 [Desulfatiferula olefinivorans]